MTPFNERIWKLCQRVPAGKVTTYKALAEAAGTRAYRAVGNAMRTNPHGIMKTKGRNMVPCHRVVDAAGRLHGFAHGLKKKAELLRREGVKVSSNKITNFEEVLYRF